MSDIRRWLIDWTSATAGGGGMSALWFSTVQGTALNLTEIEGFLDVWETLASDEYSAKIREVADIYSSSTGQKVGEEVAQTTLTHVGDSAAARLPNQAQMVIGLLTSAFVNGRRLRGRIFIPGLTAIQSFNGEPSASAIATMLAPFPLSGQQVFSRKHLTTSPVASASAFSEWAVLRRRRN